MNKDKYSFELPKSRKEFIEFDIHMRIACELVCFIIGLTVGIIDIVVAKSYLTDVPYQTILEQSSTVIELYENYNLETQEYQSLYTITNSEILLDNHQKNVHKYKITAEQLMRLKKMISKCPMERFNSSIIYQKRYLCLKDGDEVYPLKQQYNIIDIETYIKNIIERNKTI